MHEMPHKVFVLLGEGNKILLINSDAHLTSTAGWVQIDQGYGDRYHHAQGNYLPGPIRDERGICRYKLVEGQVEERTAEEMDADYDPSTPAPTDAERIKALEQDNADLKETLDLLLSGVVE